MSIKESYIVKNRKDRKKKYKILLSKNIVKNRKDRTIVTAIKKF